MSDQVVFTCSSCGAKGDPPKCDHFQQPWTPEQIAKTHKALRDAGFIDQCFQPFRAKDEK